MKKYTVIHGFYDVTQNGKAYVYGDTYECDDKRAEVLMGKNKNKTCYIKPKMELKEEAKPNKEKKLFTKKEEE